MYLYMHACKVNLLQHWQNPEDRKKEDGEADDDEDDDNDDLDEDTLVSIRKQSSENMHADWLKITFL